MIDKFLLFPYYLALKIRHALYDKGISKSHPGPIPTVCVGNITAGGTGKTPHTEMILKALLRSDDWGMKEIAVLSRGYKRRSRGFQQISRGDGATFAGDEPAQIKKNFPGITVAVCKNRLEGLDFLASPQKLAASKKGRKCKNKNFQPAEVAVLDDAFQYRALRPAYSVVLVDYNRPIYKDNLLPIGRLRDLPERIGAADAVIVTKCPVVLEDWEKTSWVKPLGIKNMENVFFTSINYRPLRPVFPEEGDNRYSYSSRAILFTGIAKDTPLRRYLSDSFKIVRHFSFPDHHKFTKADIHSLMRASEASPTAALITTEKDAQRILDCKNIPQELKQRLFYVPIEVAFLSEDERLNFEKSMLEALRAFTPEP